MKYNKIIKIKNKINSKIGIIKKIIEIIIQNAKKMTIIKINKKRVKIGKMINKIIDNFLIRMIIINLIIIKIIIKIIKKIIRIKEINLDKMLLMI